GPGRLMSRNSPNYRKVLQLSENFIPVNENVSGASILAPRLVQFVFMLKDRVVVDSIPTWGRVANKRFKPLSAAEIVAASYAGLELFIEDAPHNARRLAEGG